MGTITEGVEFDTIAREWRCKWSPDNDKKSLAEAQKLLQSVLSDIKAVDGVKDVQRVVVVVWILKLLLVYRLINMVHGKKTNLHLNQHF